MKNRKRIIVAFLCVAMLVVGVGYATITDTLTISGTAEYRGAGYLDSAINEAVHFDNGTALLNSSVIVDTENKTDNATMNVLIQDATSAANSTLYALASFEIHYDSDTGLTNLPAIEFDATNISASIPDMISNISGETGDGFAIDWGWSHTLDAENGTATVSNQETKTISCGGSETFYVLVTFTQPDTAFTSNIVATPISVSLTYNSVD